MKTKRFHFQGLMVVPLAASLWLVAPVSGQNPGSQTSSQPPSGTTPPTYQHDEDTTRGELANFDRFLDGHPELAEQLRKDPSLVNNREFVENHPALQSYLQDHPRVREEIKENPNAFMHQEKRYERTEDRRDDRDHDRDNDRRDNDTTRRELGSFDHFMDGHPEIAEQLRKDPSLVDNHEFVRNHPALQDYLQQHPAVREEIKENPNAFMRQENRYERTEDRRNDRRDGDMGRRDGDTTRRELASFDRFTDSHPEIGEQLRKDPSLVDNRQFVEQHPALHDYLKDHPEVREEIKENPNAFMHQENRYERTENQNGRDMHGDRDMHGESASFGEFLGGHSNIAEQISKDPSLLKNQEYMSNHPELQEYLKAHPAAEAQLRANPDTFIKSSQQFSTPGQNKPQTMDPKPKQ